MFPVLFNLGPVSLKGLVIVTVALVLIYFILTKIVRLKGELAGNILFLFIIIEVVAMVLMITGKSFSLRTYGLMIATGFLLATLFVMRHSAHAGMTSTQVMDLAVVLLLAGIVGTRIFYVLFFNFEYYMQNPMKIFAIWEGGQVLYGGVIFGALAAWYFLWKRGISFLKAMDLMLMSLLIGIGFGRIGCLGAGCCYGQVSQKFGISFPQNSDAFIEHVNAGLISATDTCSLPVLPTQLFESVSVFTFFVLTYIFYRKFRKFDGQVMSIVLILYSVERFVIEYFRVNPFWGPFTVAQWTSILLFIGGIIGLIVLGKKKTLKIIL